MAVQTNTRRIHKELWRQKNCSVESRPLLQTLKRGSLRVQSKYQRSLISEGIQSRWKLTTCTKHSWESSSQMSPEQGNRRNTGHSLATTLQDTAPAAITSAQECQNPANPLSQSTSHMDCLQTSTISAVTFAMTLCHHQRGGCRANSPLPKFYLAL